jgi:hypothetical protein
MASLTLSGRFDTQAARAASQQGWNGRSWMGHDDLPQGAQRKVAGVEDEDRGHDAGVKEVTAL